MFRGSRRFWHGNPEVYSTLTERQEYKRNEIIVKQKLAEDNGYRYLVIWESTKLKKMTGVFR